MGLKVWILLTSLIPVLIFQNHPFTLSSYYHSLFSVSRFLLFVNVYPLPILLIVNLCLSIVDLCLFVVDLCFTSSTFAFHPQCPSSSSPSSLRFDLSISSLRFGYLWNCCLLLLLFFGLMDLFFGFVDLLILFFRNQTSVFDLCISVEIKADRCPPELDPT